MCKFFSFISNGKGNFFFFNGTERKNLLVSNPEDYKPDSHTSIAHNFMGKEPTSDDLCNKYEFVDGNFVVDQINVNDDSEKAKAWVESFVKTNEFDEICLAAVSQNGSAVNYLKDEQRTPDVCLAAVSRDGHAVNYLKDELLTPDVCLAAVSQNGCVIRYLKDEQKKYLK